MWYDSGFLEKASLDLFLAMKASRSVVLEKNTHIFRSSKGTHQGGEGMLSRRTKGGHYREHLIVEDQRDSIWPQMKKKGRGGKKEKSWINKNTVIKLQTVTEWWMRSPSICFAVRSQCLTYPERNIKYPKFIFKLCSFVTATRFHSRRWIYWKSWRKEILGSHRCLQFSVCRLEDLRPAL